MKVKASVLAKAKAVVDAGINKKMNREYCEQTLRRLDKRADKFRKFLR